MVGLGRMADDRRTLSSEHQETFLRPLRLVPPLRMAERGTGGEDEQRDQG